MLFPQEFIEQVKVANNIVSVASRYMVLKQKGRGHWAACPFHHEKTPSFSVNEQQQFYHCFGCGVSGNVITLVMQLENVDFAGAVELLAKWAGIKIPETAADPQYAEKARRKQKILEILEEARKYYCENLYKPFGAAALEYLYKRGVGDELVKLFNIGYSPDWDSVIAHLKKSGYTEQQIIDAGVCAKSEKGRVYDAMAERIVFSIFDIYGNCIGFTGRIMPEKDKGETAKYRNTAQTAVFDKGGIVYGVDVLKKNKLANFVDKLIVVEGNVDVISLVGAGFKNTVACMGTALTPFHAKIFKRFSDRIYVCFDGDGAGQKAALRSVDILAEEGVSVRVIELPKDTDPDGFVRTEGKDAFQTLIDEAKPYIDYKLDCLERRSNLKDNLGKTEYLKAAGEILKAIKDTAELELYVPKVSAAAGVSQESIMRSAGVNIAKKPIIAPVKPIQLSQNAYQSAVNFVAASKLHKQKYAEQPLAVGIENKLYCKVMNMNISSLFDVLDNEEKLAVDHLINYDFSSSEETLAKQYNDSVKYLLKHNLLKKRDETDDITEIQKINKELARLKNG